MEGKSKNRLGGKSAVLAETGCRPCAACGLFLTAFKRLGVSNKFIARIRIAEQQILSRWQCFPGFMD